jgi:hypothetical protein
MKKIYALILTMTAFFTFAQGNEDFTNSTATASYADGSFTGNGGVAWTYGHSRDEGVYAIASKGIMLRRASDSYLEFTSTTGIGTLTFQYRKAFTGGSTSAPRALEVLVGSNILGTTPTFGITSAEETDVYNYSVDINQSGSVTVRIKLTGTSTTNRQTTIDNVTWTAMGTSPVLSIVTPADADTFNPETANVNVTFNVSNFNVANGTGDGHIKYTVNGGTPMYKYDTTPLSLTSLTPGAYTVALELVDNTNASLSTAVTDQVSFTIASYTIVADLAALRADVAANGANKYYQISSNPVITYARATRNQKYVQDASAGVLLDDQPVTISTAMVAGDALSGLKGQATLYFGLLQFLPTANATIASSGNVVTPEVVTLTQLAANVGMYESELVKVSNVTFTTADGTLAFTASANFPVSDGATSTFRTTFAEADYITVVVPQNPQEIVALVGNYNGAAQITARNMADITVLSTPSFNAITGLKVYPNPVNNGILNITSANVTEKAVVIYDVMGKQVFAGTTINNVVSISSLNSGIYMVKITEEGKTATRKIVVE